MKDIYEELDEIIKNCYTGRIQNSTAVGCGKIIPHLNEVVRLYTEMGRLAKIVRKDLGSS